MLSPGTPFAFLILICSLPAQYTFPSGTDAVDASSLGPIAGASTPLRQQVLIAENLLQPLVGRDLTALWLRRDFSFQGALQGAVIDLSLVLSVTDADPNAPSGEFARNHGSNPTTAFVGTIVIPSSPRPNWGFGGWTEENTVRIKFDSAFSYSGGTLVLDITGWPQAGSDSPFWPIDMEFLGSDGVVQDYGNGCGNHGLVGAVSEAGLEIGATAFFGAWGAPKSLAYLVLGTRLPTPFDLSGMGATGCLVYIEPLFNFPTVFSGEVMGSAVGGASVDIHVPADTSLLGITLHSQWVNLEVILPVAEWSNPIGLTTSNATKFTIGTVAPSLGMSTVTSAIPLDGQSPASTGYVEINKAPVLRFLYK